MHARAQRTGRLQAARLQARQALAGSHARSSRVHDLSPDSVTPLHSLPTLVTTGAPQSTAMPACLPLSRPPPPLPCIRLVVVLGTTTYGAKGTSTQAGTLEELVFAKAEKKAGPWAMCFAVVSWWERDRKLCGV